jgi:hypothetical protein
MALQYSDLIRNAQLDQVEVITGTAPLLTIRTLAPPANCAAANTGTVLATINLPSDWMAVAASGTKAILGGPWTESSADAAGTAGHFRIHNTAGTVCHLQGTVGTSGTDMIVDNVVFAVGQAFSISTFTLTAGNA